MPTVEQRLTVLENMLKNNTMGSMLKWRPANLNVPLLSDVSTNIGHANAGDWELGQALGRRIVISDIDKGIIDYDEKNRPYKRETYATVYFRLGLADTPGIDYNGTTTSVEIDGRCNLDDTIPFKALDCSTVTSGFVYDKATQRIVSIGMKTVDGNQSADYSTDHMTFEWSDGENTSGASFDVRQSGLSIQGAGEVAISPLPVGGEADNTFYIDYNKTVIAGGWLQFTAGPTSGLYPQRPASAENFAMYGNPTTGKMEIKLGGVWHTIDTTVIT